MQSKSKKHSKAKADKYFSLFIRERDKDEKCITCNDPTKKGGDCGHFISRRFESTRYDEQNAHKQCEKCNRFEHGRQYEHGISINNKYGKGTADKILMKSKMLCKRNQNDYEEIAAYYREKYNQLKK